MQNLNPQQIIDNYAASGKTFSYEVIDRDGERIWILFFRHASLGFIWDGHVIYVDPLSEYADFTKLPKADYILITHDHYDHLDTRAVEEASGPSTRVIGSRKVIEQLPFATPLIPGQEAELAENLVLEATPAYNVTPEHQKFHPRSDDNVGFIIDFKGTRVYIAGDTEPIPEMSGLGDIYAMFLPVDQPYTMTVEQAAAAARVIAAPLFFPYHTSQTEIERITDLMKDDNNISVRIHPME